MDVKSVNLVVFTDFSFANLPNGSTQLAFIILLTDGTEKVNILFYSSYKCKPVMSSVLSQELCAFADVFDVAVSLRHDLKTILNKNLPITMFNNSLVLFNVIAKYTTTTERTVNGGHRDGAGSMYQRQDKQRRMDKSRRKLG